MPFGLGWSITNSTNQTISEPGGGSWCETWREPQAVLYHVANTCFILCYLSPTNKNGMLFMHSLLIIGFLVFSAWAWNSICAPDAFSWSFCLCLLNVLQLFHVVYRLRPVTLDPELEEAYTTLFMPFKVPRLLFKKMVSPEFAQIMSLHAGEAYAMQNLTRTDRLGLLLSGKVNVMSDHQFLHPILPCEFLDSPEFESSRANVDDKFRVSIVAATSCRYLYWQRTALEYLFVKEAYLGTVVSTLVARDITTKLYAMNSKIMTEKGSHLDIRLPALASSLGAARSTPRLLRRRPCHRECRPEEEAAVAEAAVAAAAAAAAEAAGGSPLSSRGLSGSRERLVTSSGPSVTIKERQLPNGHLKETEPLSEQKGHSTDALDLMGGGGNGSSGVESWLETSSKYHSCEMVED